jgi:hypothetical protein
MKVHTIGRMVNREMSIDRRSAPGHSTAHSPFSGSSMTTPPERLISTRKRAARISLVLDVAKLVMKSVAYLLTGSGAILPDLPGSGVRSAATATAYVSVVLSSRNPEPSPPYGHGKRVCFSSASGGSSCPDPRCIGSHGGGRGHSRVGIPARAGLHRRPD